MKSDDDLEFLRETFLVRKVAHPNPMKMNC